MSPNKVRHPHFLFEHIRFTCVMAARRLAPRFDGWRRSAAGTEVSPDLPSNLRALEQGCMMCGHRSGCPEGSASIAAGVVPCLDFLHGRSKPTAPVGTAGVLSEQRFAHSIKYMTVCLLRCMCWPASADACKLLAEAKRLSCQGCSTNGAHA